MAFLGDLSRVLLARFAAPLSRHSIANSTLAHSSGTARGNALQNKQPRAQQKNSRATAAPPEATR
jgi:hypothetical protein